MWLLPLEFFGNCYMVVLPLHWAAVEVNKGKFSLLSHSVILFLVSLIAFEQIKFSWTPLRDFMIFPCGDSWLAFKGSRATTFNQHYSTAAFLLSMTYTVCHKSLDLSLQAYCSWCSSSLDLTIYFQHGDHISWLPWSQVQERYSHTQHRPRMKAWWETEPQVCDCTCYITETQHCCLFPGWHSCTEVSENFKQTDHSGILKLVARYFNPDSVLLGLSDMKFSFMSIRC